MSKTLFHRKITPNPTQPPYHHHQLNKTKLTNLDLSPKGNVLFLESLALALV